MMDLMDKSLLATYNYVYKSIVTESNKQYYEESFNEILGMLGPIESLAEAERKLHQFSYYVEYDKKFSWFSQGNPKKYELLAIEHALDIVSSLRNRFGRE